MDFLPTLCAIAGAQLPPDIDGIDLSEVWLDGKPADPDRTLIWVRREGNQRYQGRLYYAIRQGSLKLLQNSPFEPMQLVDLATDPHETNPKPPKGPAAKQLIQALMRHQQRAGQVPWQSAPVKTQN